MTPDDADPPPYVPMDLVNEEEGFFDEVEPMKSLVEMVMVAQEAVRVERLKEVVRNEVVNAPKRTGSRKINMAGQIFGWLTVVESRVGSDRHRKVLCRCACQCGGAITVRGADLRSGQLTSCGCGGHRQTVWSRG